MSKLFQHWEKEGFLEEGKKRGDWKVKAPIFCAEKFETFVQSLQKEQGDR